MFKTKGGGGQRLFEQCSKKLQIWYMRAPLIESFYCVAIASTELCEPVTLRPLKHLIRVMSIHELTSKKSSQDVLRVPSARVPHNPFSETPL